MGPHDRLKQLRIANGEPLESIAKRTGLAERLLRAIEEGRFEELPRGIYARAAIRTYATAIGVDPVRVLAACEPLLPAIDDPISTMGRMRGVRAATKGAHPAGELDSGHAAPSAALQAPVRLEWTRLVAQAIDACAIGVILAAMIGMAALMERASLAALDGSAPSFGLVALLLASSYFLWLGGLVGTTGGRRVVGLGSSSEEVGSLTLKAILVRAVRCATDDLRFLHDLGERVGLLSRHQKAAPEPPESAGHSQTAVARS